MLSFPSAPKGQLARSPILTYDELTVSGSVSSAAWAAVCKRVLLTAEEVVKDLLIPGPAAPGELQSSQALQSMRKLTA